MSLGRLLACLALLLFACGGQPGAVAPEPPPAASAPMPAVPPASPASFTLTVRAEGDGEGLIVGGPLSCGSQCTAQVKAASTVALEARPADNSLVAGWSLPGCDGTRCSVAVDRDLTVRVTFARKPLPPPSPAPPPVTPPPPAATTHRLTIQLMKDGAPFDGFGFTSVTVPGTTYGCSS